MIHTVPNPKMSSSEVRDFRKNLARCVSKNISPQEKKIIKERKERMSRVYNSIINNNEGKNPILGY